MMKASELPELPVRTSVQYTLLASAAIHVGWVADASCVCTTRESNENTPTGVPTAADASFCRKNMFPPKGAKASPSVPMPAYTEPLVEIDPTPDKPEFGVNASPMPCPPPE